MLDFLKSGLNKVSGIFKNAKMKTRLPLVACLLIATICASAFLLRTVKTVKIWDGYELYTVRTVSNDTGAIVASLNLKSDKYILEDDTDGTIVVKYTFPVYITVGAQTMKVDTTEDTVENILKLAGYTIDEYDLVEPAKDKVLSDTSYIDYFNIDYVKGEYEQSIPYKTETSYSSKQTTTTIKKGSEGLEKIYYTSKIVNGITVETVIDKKETIKEPVNSKKVIGIAQSQTSADKNSSATTDSSSVKCISTLKPSSAIKLDSKGKPINYKSHITVQATAYTYTGNKCSTGVSPQPGYIAVNPKFIPYGTKMYIVSSDGSFIYGYAVAADTGGFIKTRPTNVDLFMTTKAACTAFGRRNVEIYILE